MGLADLTCRSSRVFLPALGWVCIGVRRAMGFLHPARILLLVVWSPAPV